MYYFQRGGLEGRGNRNGGKFGKWEGGGGEWQQGSVEGKGGGNKGRGVIGEGNVRG